MTTGQVGQGLLAKRTQRRILEAQQQPKQQTSVSARAAEPSSTIPSSAATGAIQQPQLLPSLAPEIADSSFPGGRFETEKKKLLNDRFSLAGFQTGRGCMCQI